VKLFEYWVRVTKYPLFYLYDKGIVVQMAVYEDDDDVEDINDYYYSFISPRGSMAYQWRSHKNVFFGGVATPHWWSTELDLSERF